MQNKLYLVGNNESEIDQQISAEEIFNQMSPEEQEHIIKHCL